MSNPLSNETSLYLKKHSTHPIHWYPWGEDAFKLAKKENKAIFLSIGYSTSPWCKIMENESFNDLKISELLNERFISIKVDKNLHPQIAKFYQKVYTLMNRSLSSYPISIFMTENLEPFYASSYIAPKAEKEQLGLEELLRVISKKYITDYDTLVKKGKEVLEHINNKNKNLEATKLNINLLSTITTHVDNLLDTDNGGFGTSSKFPNASLLELISNSYQLTKDSSLLHALTLSIDGMIHGNIRNENGAFYSYSKDKEWLIPYKSIHTYNNAELSQIFIKVYHLTKNQDYKKYAFESIDFILKNMMQSTLFFSSIDESIQKDNIDQSIVTSWNAMMISTLFKAGEIDKKYINHAKESLEKLLDTLYVGNILYHDNSLSTEAFLEDYAYLGTALINAYQATLDESYLIIATQFSNIIIEKFYDYGEWNFSVGEFQIKEEIHDTEYTSSLSTTLSLLLSISSLVDNNYKKFVFKTLEFNSYKLMRQPLSSPALTSILLRYLKDDLIIKSNENLLQKSLTSKNHISYPFILFKTTVDKKILFCNSSTCFSEEENFDAMDEKIESFFK